MDRASHHDYILRTKKSFKQCIDYLPNYYESLETTKQRLLNLQTTIFSNTPFELAFNNPGEEAEADEITYFWFGYYFKILFRINQFRYLLQAPICKL